MINRLHTYCLEINAVGLRNWLWFVVCLKRDEFHGSLWPSYYGTRRYNKQTVRRARAQDIDMTLMELHRCLG